VLGIIIGLAIAWPAFAQTPYKQEVIILEPYGPHAPPQSSSNERKQASKKALQVSPVDQNEVSGGWHSTRAEKQVSAEHLRVYLMLRESPLAAHSEQLLASPHWSTIIGICTIEQYGCSKAPYNNYWGIMCGSGKLCHYESLEAGINAISNLLVKYESRGKDTLEELNGYYVVPASANWFNTVLKTKQLVENL